MIALANRRYSEPDPIGPDIFSDGRARDFGGEIKKISDFLKCVASKSLERNEANQINNRYDEHGSRQPYY